ncbi:MAG TPA: phage tail tape measure protein, partial [Patescibacteria group bacterium]
QNIAGNTNMTASQMKDMEATVLALGKSSGSGFNDLGQGYMHIVNLFDNLSKADIAKILDAANQSAISTGANVADVANSLAMVMKDFGLSADQAQSTMNILHTAGVKGNMTLEEMVTAFGQTAGEAANLNMKLPDVAAAMSALTRHGVDAAEAGTQLKNMLLKIAAPGTQATAALDALSRISGVNLVSDFSQAGLASKGLSGVLADVGKATGGNIGQMMKMATGVDLTKKQIQLMNAASNGQLAALKQLDPNIRGLYGMFVLLNNGAKDYKNTLAAMGQASTDNIVGTLYAEKLKTTSQQFAILTRNVQALGIELGDVFLPIINQLIQKFMPIIESISNWVGKNSDLSAKILEVAVGIGTTILLVGGFLTIFNKVSKTIMEFNTILKALKGSILLTKIETMAASAMTAIWNGVTEAATVVQAAFNAVMDANPIALVIIGIAALIAITILLIKYWKQITAVAQEVWQKITQYFGAIVTFIKQDWEAIPAIILGPLAVILVIVLNHFDQIKKIVGNTLTTIVQNIPKWGKELSDKINDALQTIINDFIDLKQKLDKWWDNLKKDAQTKLDNIKQSLIQKFDDFKKGVQQKFIDLGKSIKQFYDNLPQTILNGLTKIKQALEQNINDQLSSFDKFTTKTTTQFSNWLTNTTQSFQTGFDNIKKAVQKKLQDIATNIPKSLSAAGKNIQKFFQDLPTNVGNWLNDVKNTVIDFFNKLFTSDKEKKAQKKAVTNLTNNLTTGFDSKKIDMIKKIGDTLLEVVLLAILAVFIYFVTLGYRIVVGITEGIGNAVGALNTALVKVIQTIASSIGSVVGSAWKWGSDMIDNLVNGIKGGIGKVGQAVSQVADKIKGFLHFSKPDVGPLADADKWMPDMVDLMSRGLRMNLPKLQMAINGALAGTGANSTAYSYNQVNNVNINGGSNSWQQRQDMSRTLQSLSYQSQFM